MPPPKTNTELKAFRQHGFRSIAPSGEEQMFGNCIFCGSKDKFYVNFMTNAWDCKVCMKQGGFKTFLNEIAEHFQQYFIGKIALWLCRDRGLKLATFNRFNVGYNPATDSYLLPVYTADGQNVWDILRYKDKKLLPTHSCTVGILNWQSIESARVVWLCEGGWDGMVMDEMLHNTERSDEIALAVPGANVFKAEWTSLFREKIVNVVYDNDHDRVHQGKKLLGAGILGAIKVYNTIRGVPKDLKFTHWSNDLPNGYDLRDLYKDKKFEASKAYGSLGMLLFDLPKRVEEQLDKLGGELSKKVVPKGEGRDCDDVYEAYRTWLHVPDTTTIDVIYGTLIANRLQGDPLWLFLVAPPGGTKTEYLMSLTDAPLIDILSLLTPHTLISGANYLGGADPSLIPRLDGKVLVIKDFTAILNMNTTQREEIFGILRDAYDGECTKPFGNGVIRTYKSKFGIVAAVTPVIELFTEEHTALGERFLHYRIPLARGLKKRKEFMKRALQNTANEDGMRTELRTISKEALSFDFGDEPGLPEHLGEKILNLAEWTSIMRGTINRDKYSKEITHKPFIELGTRISKQFCKLMYGVGMFRRKEVVDEAEYEVARQVAISSVPSRMETITRQMYRYGAEKTYSSQILSDMVGLPSITCSRMLENLGMLGVLRRNRMSSMQTSWEFTDEILEAIELSGVYKKRKEAPRGTARKV